MFTGLVEAVGIVTDRTPDGSGVRLTCSADSLFADCHVGDSVAINGCCLTAIHTTATTATFEAGAETLQRTNLGELEVGSRVNLERSLKVGARMGGHFVTGHIDCVGTLRSRDDDGQWSTVWFDIPSTWSHHLASKGSIAVDGISLTLVDVTEDGFSVMLIPHTLEHTTLGGRKKGDRVNLETDILAKYVERSLQGNGTSDQLE